MRLGLALTSPFLAGVPDPAIDTGLVTTGLALGDVGYISSNNTLSKTDANALASSIAFGVQNGVPGDMTVSGSIASVKFTTIGGSPAVGAPVYLAPGTEEAGAAGKLTATAPSTAGKFVAEVGLCQDPAGYAGSKTATIIWKPKTVVAL